MIFARRSGVQQVKLSADLQETGPSALSALYDDRAADEVLEALLDSAASTPTQQLALKQQFRRYCVLSDALQAPELSAFEDAGFTQRLMLRLRNESVAQTISEKIDGVLPIAKFLAPVHLALSKLMPRRNLKMPPSAPWSGLAVAISVVVVSWMVLPEINHYWQAGNAVNQQASAVIRNVPLQRLALAPAAVNSASIPKQALQSSAIAYSSSDEMLSAYLTAHRPSLAVALQERGEPELQTVSLGLPDSRSEFLRGN